MSNHEFVYAMIESFLDEAGVEWVQEFQFHKKRKWRFDYYVPSLRLGIEYHGGQFTKGGHVRPVGYGKDLFKFNAAQILGYRVLQFTTENVSHGGEYIKAAINSAIFPPAKESQDVFAYGVGTNTRKRNTLKPIETKGRRKKR